MFRIARSNRQFAIVASLAFSSAICTLLLALRVIESRSLVHSSMLWNLFLAWLPMICALAAYNIQSRSGRAGWVVIAGCAFVWMLFFPNAPYLLTDIANLRPRSGIPFWYDVLMYVAFAWTGTFLGLVSLYLMHALVHRAKGPVAGWLFAVAVLVLGGFGVYLGRFPRWNSWDLFTSPLSLLADVWDRLRHPLANSQMFVFTAVFSLCLMAMYLMLVAVVHFQRDTQRS